MKRYKDLDGDQGYDEEYGRCIRKPEHPMPMQPMEYVEGIIRFRRNRLVEYLLKAGKLNMNDLAIFAHVAGISNAEQMQFAQLIGYSVDGASNLSYFDQETVSEMDTKAANLSFR
jgi:hypothetical protein